jgi:methyl-accepting chemotaxis protein
MFALSIGISLLTVCLTSGYLLALLQLSSEEWRVFGGVVAVSFVLLATAVNAVHRRLFAPVLVSLDRRGSMGPAECEEAYAATLALPVRTFVLGLVWWLLGGVLVAAGTAWWAPGVRLFESGVMVAAATSAGGVTSLFNAFMVKRMCSPVRRWLCVRVPDPDRRDSLVPRMPLARKLRTAIAGVTLVMVLFTVFLAQVRARRPLEEQLTRVQHALLAEILSEGDLEPASLEAASARARRLGLAEEIRVVSRSSTRDRELASDELRLLRESGGVGDSRQIDSPRVFAFAPLDEERVLVASMSWETLAGEQGLSRGIFFALLLLSVGVSWALGSVLARDIGESTSALHAKADRIASGDLREGEGFESEDELGDLGRAFERMGGALRRTVEGVVEAADRLEGTARELEVVGAGVSSATVDQAQGVVGARGSVERLEEQMGGIAQSTQALSGSMEESGSSVLELSASGEQLKQTARGLEERIAEVSGSLGQAVTSVREVGEQAETLFQASAETSTSMEEMASSLREVDANAEEMGRLSGRVVDAAEGGVSRVRRSMEGMEAIRAATESAEAELRSLSGRATEIGAIVDVIDTVADETNLLALNAAIIAAQAGENGRAFSVVADEIKELADRVMSSTKEIGGLIRSVQTESRSAHAAIERGMGKVVEGVELSSQAGEALVAITEAARDSGARTSEIVAAVREQSGAASHVVRLMERVRDGVERIRGAGREQDRGHEVVMAGTVAMREVAGQVHRTTEEQAQGARRIRDGVEQVQEAVAAIHQALTEQRAACGGLRRVAERTESHQESARRMADATRDLRAQAESLRDDVRKFRTRRDGSTTHRRTS